MTIALQSTAFQMGAGQEAFQEPLNLQFEIRDPKWVTMGQWADSMNMQMVLFDHEKIESDWQGWASRLVQANNMTLDQAPDPYRFDDWRAWADAFNRALTSASY